MINFLEETLDMLKDCGKTEDDVLWVGRCEYWSSGYPDVKILGSGLSRRLISSTITAMVGQKFHFRLWQSVKIFGLNVMNMMGLNGGNIRECLLNHLKLKILICNKGEYLCLMKFGV